MSKEPQEMDFLYEEKIRPQTLKEYIGQESLRYNLLISIEAARKRESQLDHILLYGSAGLGKTTLANVISREMGANLKSTSGPAIERPIDLIIILKSLKNKDILFIDEIHRLRRPIEEILYPAMEDFSLDRVLSKGVAARPIKIELPPFTLIGATTRSGMISSPMRGRFGITFSLSFYDVTHISEIVLRSSRILGIGVDDDAALEIAKRSRGTPRIANRLVRRVRDFAEVKGDGRITSKIVSFAMEKLQIDNQGIDAVDRKILETLVIRFRGKPIGLETLAASVNEEPENIEEVYEPYLLQMGFIDKTNRGRVATRLTFDYLGVPVPENLAI